MVDNKRRLVNVKKVHIIVLLDDVEIANNQGWYCEEQNF